VVAGLATGESIIVPDKRLEDSGIHVIVDEATHVDVNEKKVTVSGGDSIQYDKLFLAMGASPFIPPIEGCDLDGVLTLRGAVNAESIKAYIADKRPRKLIFIGAGFISLEVASLLANTKPDAYDITIVELMNRPLPLMLDEDMAGHVKEYLKTKGFTVLTGEKVEKILGQNGTVSGIRLASGKTLDADMVFLNVGTRPNLDLVKDMGLEMGTFGIKVNAFQETSNPDILAGGDCVEKIHFITQKPTSGLLRGPAVIQGRIAAKRLAGYDVPFPGVLNAGGCQVFEMVVSATGLTEGDAKKEGFETVSAVVDSRSKHGMIPGMKPWKIKLIFDKNTTKLIGGQIVSHTVAPAKEIDAISALILGGKTIPEITTFLCAGNPDISSEPSMEPITIAAEQALRKLMSK